MAISKVYLSIVIVSYNTKKLTCKCVESININKPNIPYEIIIVDNNSSDGTVSEIKKTFSGVNIVGLDENIGFARANNLAVSRSSGDLILLLNPDTVVIDDAINKLVQFSYHNQDSQLWGGGTVFPDMSLNPTSCFADMSIRSIFCFSIGLTALFPDSKWFNPENYGDWQRDTVREVDVITGCFLLTKKSLWTELGGFDEEFFMFAEEADLCIRARKVGAKPLFYPSATIIHHGGASIPIYSDRIKKLFCGKISLAKKHWAPAASTLSANLLIIASLVRFIGYWALSKTRPQSDAAFKASEWKEVLVHRNEWSRGYARHNEPMTCRD